MQNNTFSGLIVGQKIVVLDRVDSTNNYLKRELAKSTPFPEGTVIMAEEQYSGRGQAENKWISSPGLNLTLSILLNPTFLSPENQFDLNIAISLAINDVLKDIIGDDLKIKWPNDVYYGNNKIGGVLIENSLIGRTWKSAIIGIGLNVNQVEFDPVLKNVSSLRTIMGTVFDKSVLLAGLCSAIDRRYKRIVDEKSAQRTEYISNLYGLEQDRLFVVDDEQIRGNIKGIDPFGRIILYVNNDLRILSFKELSFVIE